MGLHRDIAVFFRRPQFAFGAHDLEGFDQPRPGLAGLNDRIHIAAAGGAVRIGEQILVLLDLLLPFCGRVGRCLDLPAMDDIGRALQRP